MANKDKSMQKLDLESLQKPQDEEDVEMDEQAKSEEDSDFELEPQEFIFLIDLSGSMYWGDKAITMAKDALKIFLHSLPEGSKFNICGFGSTHFFVFNNSVEYNQDNLSHALKIADRMDDHSNCLGGTEIFSPLEAIFGKPLADNNMKR